MASNVSDSDKNEGSQQKQLKDITEKFYSNPLDCEFLKRRKIVSHLDELLKSWVSSKTRKKGEDSSCGAYITPFGGFQFGIVTKGSDLDLLCIVPCFIKSDEFYEEFYKLLSKDLLVSRHRAVTQAWVPIIEITIDGIEVDMSIAIFTTELIPENLNLSSPDILSIVHTSSIQNIKGILDNVSIASLVPCFETFIAVVKVIKLWAKCKQLHKAPMGYPGGIAWTIMAAYVCQKYPEVSVDKIIYQFFKIYKSWNWPKAIVLKPLEDDILGLKPWNAGANASDRLHLMPVISPAYPERNTAFTVTSSHLKVCRKHFKQGEEITKNIVEGKESWIKLFTRENFISIYKHFLVVSAKVTEAESMHDWSGLVESQLRKLCMTLEKIPIVEVVQLSTDKFEIRSEQTTKWVIGLEFKRGMKVQLDIAEDVKQFSQFLISMATERSIFKDGMSIEVHYHPRKHVQQVLPETEKNFNVCM